MFVSVYHWICRVAFKKHLALENLAINFLLRLLPVCWFVRHVQTNMMAIEKDRERGSENKSGRFTSASCLSLCLFVTLSIDLLWSWRNYISILKMQGRGEGQRKASWNENAMQLEMFVILRPEGMETSASIASYEAAFVDLPSKLLPTCTCVWQLVFSALTICK